MPAVREPPLFPGAVPTRPGCDVPGVRPTCELTIEPFGARVHVVADDERFVEAARVAMARYPAAGSLAVGGGTMTLRASSLADGADDPAWPTTSMSDRGGRVDLRCGSGSMVVDVRRGQASVALPASLIAIADAVRLFVEGSIWSWLIGSGRLRAVHAGMVGNGRASALLRGASGAGKSTLTYACVRAGLAMASDDWVYAPVRRGDDGATFLAGYPWRMFLVADAAARFDELHAHPLVAHPGSDRWKLAVEAPAAQQFLAADPSVIVFLDPSPTLGIDPVASGREAAEHFWSSALASERERLSRRWVARLLDRPCYVLRRGTDPVAAAALIAEMLDAQHRS